MRVYALLAWVSKNVTNHLPTTYNTVVNGLGVAAQKLMVLVVTNYTGIYIISKIINTENY